VPSLALLFGLVLRGRFDREAAETQVDTGTATVAPRGRPVAALAILALAVGLPATFLADGGPVQAVGVVALLAFLAIGSVALGAGAAAVAAREDDG
jgi:hypothetical protein